MADKMTLVNSVLDTDASPSFIHEEFLKAEWLKTIVTNHRPCLWYATGQKVNAVGTTTLHDKIGESRVRVFFGIVQSLAVRVPLGTSFFDKFVKGLPPERNIVSYYFKPVSKLSTKDLPGKQDSMDEKTQNAMIS